MAGLLEKLEQLIGSGSGGKTRVRTFRWLLLVGLIGAALMLLNAFFNVNVKQVDSPDPPPARTEPPAQQAFVGGAGGKDNAFQPYEEALEAKLRDLLRKIVGVGEVDVMVTIESTEEIVVKQNVKDTQHSTNERDSAGATRHITDITKEGQVVLYQVSGDQKPLIVKSIKPKVRGVVVVARGAENMTVKQLLAEAVERGLDVPAHRISVLPRKQ